MGHFSIIMTVATPGQDLVNITSQINSWTEDQRVARGILTVFCRHTTASVLIQESSEPAIRRDLIDWFDAAAPQGLPYSYDLEGPDEMPAHIRAALTNSSVSIPVMDNRVMLGTWQNVYLFEHRKGPQLREIILHLAGN